MALNLTCCKKNLGDVPGRLQQSLIDKWDISILLLWKAICSNNIYCIVLRMSFKVRELRIKNFSTIIKVSKFGSKCYYKTLVTNRGTIYTRSISWLLASVGFVPQVGTILYFSSIFLVHWYKIFHLLKILPVTENPSYEGYKKKIKTR